MAPKKKAGRPKNLTIATTTKALAFRVNAPYAEWIEAFAAFNRTTYAGLIDQALARYAKEAGFIDPPWRTR
jgi:hypothetical protein